MRMRRRETVKRRDKELLTMWGQSKSFPGIALCRVCGVAISVVPLNQSKLLAHANSRRHREEIKTMIACPRFHRFCNYLGKPDADQKPDEQLGPAAYRVWMTMAKEEQEEADKAASREPVVGRPLVLPGSLEWMRELYQEHHEPRMTETTYKAYLDALRQYFEWRSGRKLEHWPPSEKELLEYGSTKSRHTGQTWIYAMEKLKAVCPSPVDAHFLGRGMP